MSNPEAKVLPLLYTTKEVAEMLRITSTTVYQLVKENKLESIKVGEQYRFSEEAIETFLNKAKE